MSVSGFAQLRRIFQRRFGISVRKVGVHSEMPWYTRAILWVILLSVSWAIAGWVYDAGRLFAGFDRKESEREVAELREKVRDLDQQLMKTIELARAADADLQVETAALGQVSSQVKALQRENLALKEDLALFEGLVSSASPVGGVVLKIPKAQLESLGQGKYRYRVLVVHQSSQKNAREFVGELRFELKVRVDGRDVMMVVPGEGNPSVSSYRLSVRHINRIEGEFDVPSRAVVVGGDVLLLQDGNMKLRQSVNM